MYFEQKLSALMHLFKLSNSKLARGINVDPSLISRWKSGERQMSRNSPHVPAIASYILHLNAYHYQRDYLDQVLQKKLGTSDRVSEASRIHALSEWLVSNEPMALPDAADTAKMAADNAAIIHGLVDLVGSSVAPKNATGIRPAPISADYLTDLSSIAGLVRQYEVFQGRQGMRQVSARLLKQVLLSEKTLDVYLTSEDDLAWMTEDPTYLAQWGDLMHQVLLRGHRITIIHVVNRRQDELMKALALWTPLHLAGSIRSFYSPSHVEQPVKRTLFAIGDQMAIVGYHTSGRLDSDRTLLYTDPETVRHFIHVFNTHLSSCKPLFSVFNQNNTRQFMEQLQEYQMQEGTFSHIRHQFGAQIMPEDQLITLLHANGAIGNRQIQVSISRQYQCFYQSLARNKYIDILPSGIIDRIRKEKTLPLTSASFLRHAPAPIRGEQLRLYLQNLIAVLKAEKNYELYFTPGDTELEKLRLDIALKENTAVYVSSPDPEIHNPITILLNENNLLQSFNFIFENIIEQIPPALKNKADVIRLLESLLHELNSGR